MFAMQRKTLLILVIVFAVIVLSGILARGMIISDFQNILANDGGSEKANLLVHHAGNVVLVWSFFVAFLAIAPVALVLRKPAEKDQKTKPAPRQTGSIEPVDLKKPIGVAASPEAAGAKAAQGDSELIISVHAMGEEPEAEDEDAQVHVSDPDRLKKIIQGLEELAQAQALGSSLQRQQLELALHLSGAVEKTRESLQDREIRFDLECENGLTVQADPDCLAKIITNLLDNAAKAVQDGGVVTVSAAAQNGNVMIAVQDTGVGIRRKDLPHIFERFYRASGSGIGLGLTIVRELVEACGGRIEVETTRGKGSLVTVRIPHV